MVRIRGRLMSAGKAGKTSFGGLLVLTGAFVLTGLDKTLEAALVGVAPEWLLGLTTRF
jgi:cytochrome c-type biogenesis protein